VGLLRGRDIRAGLCAIWIFHCTLQTILDLSSNVFGPDQQRAVSDVVYRLSLG
jgi:hypothetical protein